MKIRLFSVLVLLLFAGSAGAADGLLVVSWNIKDLGPEPLGITCCGVDGSHRVL